MQITHFRRWVSAFAAIVMAPLAGAQECGDTAPSTPAAITYVHYEQLGACVAFYEGETPVFADNGYAHIVFRITKIVNTDPGAILALVQPDHFFIQGNPDDTAIGYYSLQWVRPKPMPVVYVDPGKTAEPRGTILIDVDFDWGDPLELAVTQPFLLQYLNGPSAQGIILIKDNLDKVAWARTGNCKEIEEQPGQGAL